MTSILETIKLLALCIILTASNSQKGHNERCLTLHGEEKDIIDAREMLNTKENVMNCMFLSLANGRIGQTRSILDLYEEQYQSQMIAML